MTITEAIRKHGLEFLRGRVVTNGNQCMIINDKDLDAAIELWEDEPENAHRQRRFYGSFQVEEAAEATPSAAI